MARAIICKGDPTSHGGQVLEGSADATIDGRPIALRGHLTYCPLCKGKFPISEGLVFHTFGGLGTAVEGMKTGCGAILIATQHQMTVDDQPGASTTARSKAERSAKHTAIATPVKPPAAAHIAMVYIPHKRLNAQQREDYDKYLMRASTLQVLASFKNKAARRKRSQSKSASIKQQWDTAKIRLVNASVHAGVNPETVVKLPRLKAASIQMPDQSRMTSRAIQCASLMGSWRFLPPMAMGSSPMRAGWMH
ncbi:PAAR domain-containing protein [Massilia sp. BJB1822]|uniref:PAAR domain-containing protein n=1 Tax=Massilia sp. BJB1822 TaxID=2744470 RepID=UPI0015941591|nr:PAAR domain-containing protein [Massilia sp. BJB1822]NVD98372.1 PAAR domain-containing protein [Massilia sp. BJB1822]